MQNTIFYVAANETLGVVRDYANAKNATAPTLVRGVEACLKMRLFAKSDGPEPYPLSAFENVVAWAWAMDNDFNEATSYKLVGDNADITVTTVTEEIDEEEYTYTEVSIPTQLYPDNTWGLNHAARYYREIGNYKKSIEILKHAVELDPNDYVLVGNLGYAYELDEDYLNAKKWYEFMLTMDNLDAVEYGKQGLEYIKGKY